MIQVAQRCLGPANAGELVSREEFAAAEFLEPFTYERVRGRLVAFSPRSADERRFSRIFRRELMGYWGTRRELIDDVDVEGWVATSPDDDRIPDICVYLAASRAGEAVPDRVPDLIFEFVSGSRADQERDYVFKRAEFHALGVKEYVIVDRFKSTVLVLAWQKGDYRERTLGPSDQYTTTQLPGLVVKLSEVFPADDE